MTVQLSDPKPAYCSGCHNSPPDGRYVDFDAAFDAGAFADRESQAYVEGSDDLHLCEACVRDAMNVLELKPELHARQFREIQRLELERDHWRDYARRVEQAVQARPEPAKRGPGRPRKVAA